MQSPHDGKGKVATKFALCRYVLDLPGAGAVPVWFDGNGKITCSNGTFAEPAANAFSLVQVKDCPFATAVCTKDCYVHRLESAVPDVHAAYQENSSALHKLLHESNESAAQFSEWIGKNCIGGFRWHVAGDIVSLAHAEFIAAVCRLTPGVSFWIYTRSFPYLKPVSGMPNLTVNLSADADNIEAARDAARQYGLRICYMTVDGLVPELPPGSVIFPSYQIRGRDLPDPKLHPWWAGLPPEQRKMVCPPDFFGQNEALRCGPCRKCL